MFLHTDDIQSLKQAFFEQEQASQRIAQQATRLQALAKRSIFAVHRGDLRTANELLREVGGAREHVLREYGELYAKTQNAWRAFEEELLEAQLFLAFAERTDETLVLPTEHPERVIGALSDLLGEVARMVVRDVTENQPQRHLVQAQMLAGEVLDALLELDATGHARQKVDQARQHARKIEDVAYDLALRRSV